MNKRKVFFTWAVLLATLLTSASCKKQKDLYPLAADGMETDPKREAMVLSSAELSSYTVVYPESTDGETLSAVDTLISGIKSACGIKLQSDTDYLGKNETVPAGTKEILVGVTNRPETIGVRYLDYVVTNENGRIVITGGSGEKTSEAVEWFLKNCIKDGKIKVPGWHRSGTKYQNESMTVDGIPLKYFTVPAVKGDTDDTVRKYLGNKYGILSKSNAGYQIQLKLDDQFSVFQYAVRLNEKTLEIVGSFALSNLPIVVENFISDMEKLGGTAVELSNSKTIDLGSQMRSVEQSDIDMLRANTDQKIAQIRNTQNMSIPAGAKVYYISPNGNDSNNGTTPATAWKTVDKVNNTNISSGSYVCFERGGVWRNVFLTAKEGVTYTAYGEGEKPCLYGSPEDGASRSKWTEVAKNIWCYQGSENMKDVGALVFNGGEAVSIKVTLWADKNFSTGDIVFYDLATYTDNSKTRFTGYQDLSKDLQIFQDSDYKLLFTNPATNKSEEYFHTGTKKLYLYSVGNPGERFDSIEFCVGRSLVSVKANNVTFDNICFKYTGVHGIGAAGNVTPVKNLLVQNCEFAWIGGSVQSDHLGRNFQTRLGNAVEIYGACDGFIVQNNYMDQIYDTAMTVQANFYNVSSELRGKLYMKNVKYLDNVIEHCEMAFEIWCSDISADNPSRMENYLVQGNHVWYTSYGFCEQRPVIDQGWSAAVKNRCSETGNRATNYVIKDNIFAFWKNRALQCTSNLFNPDGSDSLPDLSGNIYVEVYGKKFGQVEVIDKDTSHTDANYNMDVVAYMTEHRDVIRGVYLKKHSDGTDQFWFAPEKK